jgi:penicillin amidase
MKRTLTALALLVAAAAAGGYWYVHGKQPQRAGSAALPGLHAQVAVDYDERGVPHIQAHNEADMYRALGYVQAQDRLFQMEILRRLARGELAQVLGSKLLDTDRLFRTIGLREHADRYAAQLDMQTPENLALQAYLDGINQFQASHPAPIEFDLLGIQPRPFTPADVLSVAGYMAYSFAAAFRTEPVLTHIRDQLGADYLKVFDLDWHPQGVLAQHAPAQSLTANDWQDLNAIAALSLSALEQTGLPQFEGSNAWAVAGSRTASGKPLLAGDPHIRFAVPSVWYEASLSYPGFNLYGHHQALNPVASLGHNRDFAWSLTMFQNDDLDLVAEKTNPDNPNQVWHQGQWVELQSREERIEVKDSEPVTLTIRRSPNGPIINSALGDSVGSTPIAMWWSFLETANPILKGFYQLNRAGTLEQARTAVEHIEAPGLNVVWANASGDIAWWAAAKLPRRPAGVNPSFILDGASTEADKLGFYPFTDNPQEENPARGYIVSANFQPVSPTGIQIPGYYNLAERGQRLNERLSNPAVKWDVHNSQALQLEGGTAYPQRLLKPIAEELRAAASDPQQSQLVEELLSWDGQHQLASRAATVFNQLVYQLSHAAMADELGQAFFANLLQTRALDSALPRLTADALSPWWDDRTTEAVESRGDIVKQALQASLQHLQSSLGTDINTWHWGQAHTLTHNHPLGQQQPLDKLFNVGPFAAPGGRETPNNLSYAISAAPWQVVHGPSTRRLIDLADASQALGINPVGQSGVLFDEHYADQAEAYIRGEYQPMHLDAADIQQHSRSQLLLQP